MDSYHRSYLSLDGNRRFFTRSVHLLKQKRVLIATSFLFFVSLMLLYTQVSDNYSSPPSAPRGALFRGMAATERDIDFVSVRGSLREYPPGPSTVDGATVDDRHLHGRFNVDSSGRPLWTPDPLTFRMTEDQKKQAHEGYCFNTRVSKSLPLDRLLPNKNQAECRAFDYSRYNLPVSDVVIVFHNEDLSVLLRSVASVLNRTPRHLLGEILLFNDDSNKTSHPWLFDELPRVVQTMPKTRLLYSTERRGLMMARIQATSELKQSAGIGPSTAVVYLDSHIECQDRWLEPLAFEIFQDRKTIVTPMIHTIDADDFTFEGNALGVLSFSWTLGQTHPSHPEKINNTLSALPPLVSPVMAGGLFAADRKWFIDELQGYDEEMKLYGGEEMEIGFKTWMCGGRLLNVPCSHIGHVFRTSAYWKGQVYKVPMEEISRNKRRVAEVWLDEYIEIYNEVAPPPGVEESDISAVPGPRLKNSQLPTGDLTKQKKLRETCKPFKWFLETVAKDVWIPDLTSSRKGAIFNAGNEKCLDNMQVTYVGEAGLYQCHGGKGSQAFLLNNGELRVSSGSFKTCIVPKGDNKLYIQPCDDDVSLSRWNYEPLPNSPFVTARVGSGEPRSMGLMHYDDKCLSMKGDGTYLKACDENDKSQLIGWD